jgi:hypothetical protein
MEDARKKRKPRRRTVADPLKRRPTIREMMDWTQEQRCAAGYCLGASTAALTPAAICKSWKICENTVLGTMTTTTANAPPHWAAYTDWSPSDKMEPGDSLRLSIALYHRLSTANFYRQIRYGKFSKRIAGDMVRVWRTS